MGLKTTLVLHAAFEYDHDTFVIEHALWMLGVSTTLCRKQRTQVLLFFVPQPNGHKGMDGVGLNDHSKNNKSSRKPPQTTPWSP